MKKIPLLIGFKELYYLVIGDYCHVLHITHSQPTKYEPTSSRGQSPAMLGWRLGPVSPLIKTGNGLRLNQETWAQQKLGTKRSTSGVKLENWAWMLKNDQCGSIGTYWHHVSFWDNYSYLGNDPTRPRRKGWLLALVRWLMSPQ